MPTSFEIPASPAKAFFVEMITRDIELQDAILDLLDNCVDGIRRNGRVKGGKPYSGYFAHITFSETEFVIEDNCGGIPLDIAKQYAFMMGRPAEHKDSEAGTIGVYGIGMKRAIFKMGRACVVHSHAKQNTFEIEITKKWLDDDSDWKLEAYEKRALLKQHGTRITVSDLHPIIRCEFAGGSEFHKKFAGIVRDAYSLLLEKGFEVKVNQQEVAPKLPTLLWDNSEKPDALRPYVYEAKIDRVSVFLVIGFREPPETPTDEESDAKARYSSEDAGWTIVCNDRVILPYDKTRQTGWGWGGVPSYHTQFIAITGFVIFDGDPAVLPMTTTKRGVDANSPLYTTVRERMQEGLLKFTKFTNDWKGFNVSHVFAKARPISLPEIQKLADEGKVKFRTLNGEGKQRQALPHLPERPKEITDKLISFRRPIKDIKVVSQLLFETEDRRPSEVGSECFDFVLRKVK
jgi:Histidine kinase-, DNA gyrase B-, and HSP90-like ATPase